jgi:AraC family transcriptional regulator
MDPRPLVGSASMDLQAGLESKIEEFAVGLAVGVPGSAPARIDALALADAMAAFLPHCYVTADETPPPGRHGLPRHRLLKVLHFISENLAADVSVAQLASVAGMSPHYFSGMFRQTTGCTPHQYVLRQRIECAKRNLSVRGHIGHSVIEAALEAGFQNPSHFARVFRRFVGVSPSRFRSAARAMRHPEWNSPQRTLPA